MESPEGGDGGCQYVLNQLGVAALTQRDDPAEAVRLSTDSREILERLGVVVPDLPDWA